MGKECYAKAHTDSTAALAIAVGESGSWKIRHLRRRAHALRWRVPRKKLACQTCPGFRIARNKALYHEKFIKFRRMMGMEEITQEDQQTKQV